MSHSALWALDPAVKFLNHGSFGACPRPVLARQRALQDQMESEPVRFFLRELPPLWDAARAALARFVGCRVDHLVSVTNATTGVNAVLRSLPLGETDEVLVTNHTYPACQYTVEAVARDRGARIVVVEIPFPIAGPDQVVEAILTKVTSRTRLALLDHVTSPTALVLPVERLVPALRARGVLTLIDGAHAPGMLPLQLDALGPDFYTGNCHKWLCAPKGAAFLYVAQEHQHAIHPLVTSHGARAHHPSRSRFLLEFGWTGTDDPTPFLCVPEALSCLAAQDEEGWAGLMGSNHRKVVAARALLLDTLQVPPPCPEAMLGTMASVPLPQDTGTAPRCSQQLDALQDRLLYEHGIEVPVLRWPAFPKRLLRVSSQLYNTMDDYQKLALALRCAL